MFVAVAIALMIGTILLIVVNAAVTRHPEKARLGSHVFTLSEATKRAEQAALGPLFFNDLVTEDNRDLPLVLAYLGDGEWAALDALAPGARPECAVQWNPTDKVLVDPCTKTVYAPDGRSDDGKTLTRFVAKLDEERDRLTVDLQTPLETPIAPPIGATSTAVTAATAATATTAA